MLIEVQAGLGADAVIAAVCSAVANRWDALPLALRGPLAAVRAVAGTDAAPWLRDLLGELDALITYWPAAEERVRPDGSFCEAVDAICRDHDERRAWGAGAGPAAWELCAAVASAADEGWSVTAEVVEHLQSAAVEIAEVLMRDGETLEAGDPAWEMVGQLVRGGYGMREEAARAAA